MSSTEWGIYVMIHTWIKKWTKEWLVLKYHASLKHHECLSTPHITSDEYHFCENLQTQASRQAKQRSLAASQAPWSQAGGLTRTSSATRHIHVCRRRHSQAASTWAESSSAWAAAAHGAFNMAHTPASTENAGRNAILYFLTQVRRKILTFCFSSQKWPK